MRSLFILLLAVAIAPCGLAQAWSPTETNYSPSEQPIRPKKSRVVSIDGAALKDLLFGAPHEKSTTAETSNTSLVLPLPDGGFARYRIVGYDITEAAALAKYPNIRTWYGINVNAPAQSVFLDWTERGFHASVRGGSTEAFFIDPISRRNTDQYQVYRKSDFSTDGSEASTCQVDDHNLLANNQTETSSKTLGNCELMQYRTTITATGKYSNYHGAASAAQSGLVQSAIVTTINRINQIFTRDLSLRLQLVANNDLLYQYTPNESPFEDNSVNRLFNRNTAYTTGIIGVENYDYGHLFTQGTNSGIASLRASCVDSRKAAGATSRFTPEGDFFDIDYLAHEMGHNLGANHTQNNSCNYNSGAGMEPGSASSIMGYAGVCSPNVQTSSDAYFHGRSIEEITAHLKFGNGGCGTTVNTSINNPDVMAQADKTIPAGTPFVLKAEATTASGTLSFNWEQYDPERGEVMPPEGTNTQGPLFRSFTPKASDERFFPDLHDVLSGTDAQWEKTPTVTRDMSFRATVINYNAAYGCAAEDDISIVVDASGRPFTVTDPNDGNQWSIGQTAQVQWDVAETDGAPYNSQLVDVLLSTDGGMNFQVLLENTPNDGLAEVDVPAQVSPSARIMVKSKDNVFYNVSQSDFSIVSSVGAPAIELSNISPLNVPSCDPTVDTAAFSFLINSSGGASSLVTWTVTNLPPGVTQSYSINPVRPGGAFELTLSGLDTLPYGMTQFTLRGTSNEGTLTETVSITKNAVSVDDGAAPNIITTANQNIDIRPILSADSTANATYDFQLSKLEGFSRVLYNITDSPSPQIELPDYLDPNSEYHWRIRKKTSCNTSQWAQASFTTADCRIFSSTEEPATISDADAPQFANMGINVPVSASITDVDLYLLNIEHSYIQDLSIDLVHPSGASVLVWDRACTGESDMLMSFDDESTETAFDCPPVNRGFFPPSTDALSSFDGLNAEGVWELRVRDNANADGGSLNAFSIKLCLTNLALPVTFLSFNAAGKKDHIALAWETETETDNYGFFVERSRTGADIWQELGFVAASTDYKFDDREALPHTDYLYRLRQQDLDGRVSYSEVRAARFGDGGSAGSLNLFPNPTPGDIRYQIPGADNDLPYTLIDVSGRVLASGILSAGGGTLKLDDRPAGVYFVRTAESTYRVVRL